MKPVDQDIHRFTPLPPSPLRTAGAGLQESLHHYALRMSSLACISLSGLEQMLLREVGRDQIARRTVPASWIGPRGNFRVLLGALERYTGVSDLHRGTFHVVSDVIGSGGTRHKLPKSKGDERAWCPTCYLQWDDSLSNEPLLWAFDMLSACPVHGTLLETRCPACNAPQRFGVPYRRRRICEACQASLAHDRGAQEINKQNIWVNQTLRSFAEWIDETSIPISSTNFRQFLDDLKEKQADWKSLPPVVARFCNHIRIDTRNNARRPTTTVLLNLAAFQGTTIQAILSQSSFAGSKLLFDSGNERFNGLLFQRRDLTTPLRRIVFVLADLIANQQLLPPPGLVWLELGLWVAVVQDICPLEHGRYMERYRAQRNPTSAQRFKQGVKFCLDLLKMGNDAEEGEPRCISILRARGFAPEEARISLSVGKSLFDALNRSLEEAALDQFDAKRAAEAAQWASGGSEL